MAESIRSIDRALDLLEHLSNSDTYLGPTKLAELSGLDKSTVFRILGTLVARGYVIRSDSGTYTLGATFLAISSRYIGTLELQTEARPFLSQLATDMRLTTRLGILEGHEVVYVERLDYVPATKLYDQIGSRWPAYCTSLGKCLLSTLSGDELSEVMADCDFKPFTKYTITNLRDLREQLRVVRNQGWAIDDEELAVGLICVGAPIYDYRGEITASVSCSGSKSIITKQHLPEVIEAVKRTARGISKRMGYNE